MPQTRVIAIAWEGETPNKDISRMKIPSYTPKTSIEIGTREIRNARGTAPAMKSGLILTPRASADNQASRIGISCRSNETAAFAA